MSSKIRGTVSARLTQKRRDISRSSGFSSATAVTVRSSRVIPQIGHDPGAGRTISGCMGQVYSIRAEACGTSGSSAIPHEGQAPGSFAWTSGHMGHTYVGPAAGRVEGWVPSAAERGERVGAVVARYFGGSASNFSAQPAEQK